MLKGVTMKKQLMGLYLMLVGTLGYALPEEALLHFEINEVVRNINCPQSMMNATAALDYAFDFKRNMGQAHLRQLKDVSWLETLFPLGLTKYYAFMSDMKPKKIVFGDGSDAYIYRIIFHLYKDGSSRLLMMLGDKGECIMQSGLVSV